jgi:hypothetical protein
MMRAFASMNKKGSSGNDRISPPLLAVLLLYDEVKDIILKAMNHSLKFCQFPQEMKLAKVKALPKAKAGEYRPISLLSCLGKWLEKIITARLRYLLHDKLAAQQHGCKAGHSTQQALVRFMHSGAIAAASDYSFGGLAFDFSKAYDRVSRFILIMKLDALNIPSQLIIFIDHWLQDRKFQVWHRNVVSRTFTMLNGIPQGSALSVILWLIYINDLGHELDPSRSNLFMDDTLLWAAASTTKRLYQLLQQQASIVMQWAVKNKVIINWDKTQLIHNDPDCQDFRLKVHNQILTPSKYLTYLGVRFISTNQSRALSLDLVAPAQDIRRRAAVIKRLHRYHFPQNIMRNFVSAFCLGKLRYFTPLLGAEIHHKQTLDPLVKALNACLRTELDAVPTTPIPLLYAGTQRP